MILSLNMRKRLLTAAAALLAMVVCSPVQAQDARVVRGVVLDALQVPVNGASVRVLQATASTKTDSEGKFSLNVPANRRILQVSHVGKATQDVNIGTQDYVVITMKDSTSEMDEVVIVGYGKQKRESVVAAVSQTTGKVLERAGGVSSIGAALTGNVPGLITAQSTGLPGEEDPQLLIRGRGTWNNSNPIILVDGVERSMNNVDIGSVETVTVLKDASATAVFGSRGANGVILITTKRGKNGRASIRGTVNTIVKVPSKLPGKYDAYDALRMRNQAIEYELAMKPEAWVNILPEDMLQKYRNPANIEEAERYPNVDWVEALFKDYATSNNANINISGGTRAVKYFTSLDFLSEGDLFKIYDNKRGYKPGFGFKRLNVRSNLDFQLTPSTVLKTNLSGSYGVRKSPWGFQSGSYGSWIDAYTTAPDVFLPVYSDGSWGYYAPNEGRAENSPRSLALGGVQYQASTRITTDFILEQNLDMLVKGLKFSGTLSMDNNFQENGRGVNDLYNDAQRKWIDPVTGIATYKLAFNGVTNFDFQEGIKWSPAGGTVGGNDRRLFYQLQLYYAKNIANKHSITAMGLLNRNIRASGSTVPSYREDWVFRTTYSFNNKYTIEYNGAYNGSERFSPDYRFAFFSSGGVNWMVSREEFMNSVKFVDMLKLRASFGQTGFDEVGGGRWLYLTDWAFGGRSRLGTTFEAAEQSPYNWYRETTVGNPNVQWEQSQKANLGLEYELFRGLVKGKLDFFYDKRSRILLTGDANANPRRTVPSYYGATPSVANLGKVDSKGYEIELNFSKNLNRNARVWADLNLTHSQNRVVESDDPALFPDYQKNQNYQIGQTRSHVSQGYYNTWDELYGSTIHNANDNQKLPGNYHIVDYNGDGVIDAQDQIPYGHTGWPQNTYNATFGFDWKGFSIFAQFYGVNNVTRQVVFSSMTSQSHLVYEEGSYWSKDNVNADVPMLRWLSTPAGYYRGTQYMHDGAYLRLKNAEVAYTFTTPQVKRFGLSGLRIYLNGNNLLTWSKMPDDRESNFAGTGWASQGAYPTVKRYNLGANITF